MYFEYNYIQVFADTAHQIQPAASVWKSMQTSTNIPFAHGSLSDYWPMRILSF